MKKKFLILAAVAVSGVAAVVASNTNKVFGASDAEAHDFEVSASGTYFWCEDAPGSECESGHNSNYQNHIRSNIK